MFPFKLHEKKQKCLPMSLSFARLPFVSLPGTSSCLCLRQAALRAPCMLPHGAHFGTGSQFCLGLAAPRIHCLPPHGQTPPLRKTLWNQQPFLSRSGCSYGLLSAATWPATNIFGPTAIRLPTSAMDLAEFFLII